MFINTINPILSAGTITNVPNFWIKLMSKPPNLLPIMLIITSTIINNKGAAIKIAV